MNEVLSNNAPLNGATRGTVRGARHKTLAGTAVVAVLALVVAGCSGSSSHASAPPSTSAPTTTTNGAPPPSVTGALQVIPGTANGSSACEQAAPVALSPGEVGAGTGGAVTNADVAASEHGGRGMLRQKTLSYADRMQLQTQMEEARAVAAKYPTSSSALAAGYEMSTPYVPCIGAHYTNFKLASSFNPSAPSELLYDGTQPDSKIVGLSYLVWHPGGPPPGFAGQNDHWHQHNANGGLCLRGGFVVGGEETTPTQCANLGGHKTLLIDIWMLHAWVVPGFECSWGVFSGECPELGGRLGGTAWQTPAPVQTQRADSTGG